MGPSNTRSICRPALSQVGQKLMTDEINFDHHIFRLACSFRNISVGIFFSKVKLILDYCNGILVVRMSMCRGSILLSLGI